MACGCKKSIRPSADDPYIIGNMEYQDSIRCTEARILAYRARIWYENYMDTKDKAVLRVCFHHADALDQHFPGKGKDLILAIGRSYESYEYDEYINR